MALPTNPHGGAGNKGLPNSPSSAGKDRLPQAPSGPRSNNPRPRVSSTSNNNTSNNNVAKTRNDVKNRENSNGSRSNTSRPVESSEQRDKTQRAQQLSQAPKRRPMSIKEKLAQSNAQKVSRESVINKDGGVRQSDARGTDKRKAPVKNDSASVQQNFGKSQGKNETAPEKEGSGNNVPDGYAVDPVTGKMYKKLPANDKDLVKQYNRSNGKMEISIEQMRQTADSVDIDLHNMEKSADMFLAHLRVPPDKEEIERLKQERIRLANKQKAEFEDEQNLLLNTLGSLEPDPDEVWDPDKI